MQERLQSALAESGLSRRALARMLAGPAATERRVENVRRQIAKWLRGDVAPGERSARRLAHALNRPPDEFVTVRRQATRFDKLEQRVSRLEHELAGVRNELALSRRRDRPAGHSTPT